MFNDQQKIKAIIFDWGGVCCSEGEPFASIPLQEKLGKGPEDIMEDVSGFYLDYYRGKYDADSFWGLIMRHFGLEESIDINSKELTQAYIDSYQVWQDVLDVAKRLQQKYNVALLSDLTPEMRDHIRKAHNTRDFFPVEMYSCDDGVAMIKQDGPAIFELLLSRMGVAAEDVLFVDNSKSKIKVADSIGIQTILFQDRNQFFRDISPFLYEI